MCQQLIYMRVAFLHPDLGIGGAERLVVDCALALQESGHNVTIFTSHHDPAHAFDETRDGTLTVKVLGNSLFPRHIGGKLAILFAILRQLHLTASLVARKEFADIDVFFVDQLSAAVPYLRMYFPHARILFYCHHPDLLLTARSSMIKKLYRFPFDTFERWSTSKSDRIAVNSEYTRKVFFETFGRANMPDPSVVYPIVDATKQPLQPQLSGDVQDQLIMEKLEPYTRGDDRIALSINRFERKKDIDLAVSAFSLLMHARADSHRQLLIVAGGYDERVPENIEYLAELQKLAKTFRIPHATKFPQDSWSDLDLEKTRLLFLPSVSSSLKNYLLANAALLLYTPTNEHFGIVPLEAMSAETPVLATNTGGPLETIEDGVSGWLRPAELDDWYPVVLQALMKMPAAQLHAMGQAGRVSVMAKFSMETLRPELNKLVLKTKETERKNELDVTSNTKLVTVSIGAAAVLGLVLLYILVKVLIFIGLILLESTQW